MADALCIWTITKNPSDFPGQFVARRHEIQTGTHGPTEDHFVANTLEGVRRKLPPHLTRLGRSRSDDPVIVECWM